MPPLYFLPHARAADFGSVPLARQLLAARGLWEVWADVPLADFLIAELKGRGPGDLPGLIIGYQTPGGLVPSRLGYYPAEQVWQPAGDGGLVWLGLDPLSAPLESDLRRRKLYPGYQIELADGQKWQVPLIRRADGSTGLPTDFVWDASGQLVEPLKPAYQKYWDDSAEAAGWFYGDEQEGRQFGGPTFSKARALELAVQALALNYRFGRAEQQLCRVLDSTTYLTVLAASVDVPGVMERLQKKTPPAASSSPGGAA